VPIWILGSSLFGAELAAHLGLPYAFASHFAPDHLEEAIRTYRGKFRSSRHLKEPYLMLGLNVFAADSDREAERLLTSLQQAFMALRRGTPCPLPPPIDSMSDLWTELERDQLNHILRCCVVGSPTTVRRGLAEFVERTRPDEIMVTAMIFDHAARLRSFEIVSDVSRGVT
jgi:luciferase family oxidoreductase group 1